MATSFHDNQLIERFLMVSAEYLGTKYVPPSKSSLQPFGSESASLSRNRSTILDQRSQQHA